ncbi:hypothetical protein [Inediibacterium massiliense]|uniref:hypothetical protein n=1 Tax=Inediibacterium massiliense TaxID=1658111 RepID=UPI0018FE73E1|nr:hypothetical protein [Inediibacterium massiliense]
MDFFLGEQYENTMLRWGIEMEEKIKQRQEQKDIEWLAKEVLLEDEYNDEI